MSATRRMVGAVLAASGLAAIVASVGIMGDSGWNSPPSHVTSVTADSGWNVAPGHVLADSGWNVAPTHVLADSGWNVAPIHPLDSGWN